MDALWILVIGTGVVLGGILVLRLHAFLALLLGAYIVASLTPRAAIVENGITKKLSVEAARKGADQSAMERVTREFGGTAGRVGILIAFGTIIGQCLLESGGADRIVRELLRWLGEKRAAMALLVGGFVLGIPVFFDTVFLLMIPLAKALRLRTGSNYLLYVLSIIAGGSMTHSLVPPTPGPLFIATELKVNMGLMTLGGIVVGIGTASCGFAFARWVNRRREIPLRDAEEIAAPRDEKELPPFWLAMLPIALPVVLITAGALNGPGNWKFIRILGDANVALAIASVIGLWTLWRQGKTRHEVLSTGVSAALEQAGCIILITSAGGAFGGMLQQSGIGPRLLETAANGHIGILPLAWAFTAIVRIAQGSTTVAMITAVGALGSIATPQALGFHPLWVALAIGCGSKPIPWMNDSGFWVISKMSGLTEKECLSTYSVMVTLMGIVGLLIVMALARLVPLV